MLAPITALFIDQLNIDKPFTSTFFVESHVINVADIPERALLALLRLATLSDMQRPPAPGAPNGQPPGGPRPPSFMRPGMPGR